jgi:nucleoside transporter
MSDPIDPDELAALAPPTVIPLPPPEGLEEDHPGASFKSHVGFKLSASMFLHHFTLGSWIVTLGSYIKANSGTSRTALFSAGFVGVIYGAGPLGGMVSPFISGLLADRFFATERIMAVLQLGAAAALVTALAAESQTVFYLAVVVHFVFFWPSFSLATSLSFHHLAHPQRHFPLVRACGTGGWIAAGVFVGWLWPLMTGDVIETKPTPMKIAVVSALITAAFCLWLPHTPPTRRDGDRTVESRGDMWRLLRQGPFIVLLALAALAHMPSQFYYAYSNVYLNWMGVTSAAAKMTMGQVVEVVSMILLPAVLLRVSVKWSIVAGLGVWSVRFWLLAAAADAMVGRFVLVYGAILLHGVAFTLVTISLQLEVDRSAGRRRRATAQGLLSVAMQGIGCFFGAELAGLAGARLLPAELSAAAGEGWHVFWTLPAWGAAAVALIAAVTLPRDNEHLSRGGDGNNLFSERNYL